MQRNNTFRVVLIALALVWSGYQLYPTFMTAHYKDQAEGHLNKISQTSGLSIDELNNALRQGRLEQQLRSALAGRSEALPSALEEATKLIALDDKLAKHEPRAIKRGLDLQGGSYLVFEVDLPKMARDLAKNKDGRFEDLMRAVEAKAKVPNVDFFDVLTQEFAAAQVRLNRYWGNRSQTDAQIVEDLKKNATDSVDRNLEILRNRIDQFGVSEPSITRQGDRRIVVELAGITDVGRAKGIIGKTAQLKFSLVRDPEITNDVIVKINTAMKRSRSTSPNDSAQVAEAAPVDTTKEAKVRSDEEVSVSELFPGSTSADSGEQDSDSTLLVDKEILSENPFSALIGALGPDIGVPEKNVRAVERVLNTPEVRDVIPADATFLWSNKTEQLADTKYYRLYLVKSEAELTGTSLTDARANIGSGGRVSRQGEWEVSMEMNSEGARTFADVTGANVNKRLAILLDDKVVTAPNINERIPGGRAVIHGNMDANEARDLAIVLRAGALQAPMHIIEERTVGPSLGRDSIAKGQFSALTGFFAVALFMLVYYRFSGLIANLALFMNVIVIFAALAQFKATLTLPGIAGIILVIGMAVDANVLIFERIREELRGGKTVKAAIDAGYDRAFWTIFDSNITTMLTAIVLMQFGTGPIRGFAVTLTIGIAASMFTAIVVTHVIYDWLTSRRRMASLSI
jgi:preprotein translocase subunit SecD